MRRRHRRHIQQKTGNEPFFKPKLQKKVEMGKPGDKYEVEADKMADQVVHNSGAEGTVQKKEGEEEVQQKPLADSVTPLVQKMEGAEEESVQKMEEEMDQTAQMKEDEEMTQKKEEEDPVQQKNEKKGKGNNLETQLKNNSGGAKMNPKTLTEMESGFGADFSNVNIHTDNHAKSMSKEIGAQAFTHGNDIYFNEGKYSPETKEGKHLLAHELTHTIQQNGHKSKVQKDPEDSSQPTSWIERMKVLKEAAIDGSMTDQQELEFIAGLNEVISDVTISSTHNVNPVVKKNPGLGNLKPKEIYFDKNNSMVESQPAVTKPGGMVGRFFVPNRIETGQQAEGVIFIGVNIILETPTYVKSVLEHEGVHIDQIYNNTRSTIGNDEVLAYSRQYDRIFAFSSSEVYSQLTNWCKYYAMADSVVQDQAMEQTFTHLMRNFERLFADNILNEIPSVKDWINSRLPERYREKATYAIESIEYLFTDRMNR